jgi:formylglycine-generating enzyme required for sulfatase activity/class 3 adenylate cyclase
MPESQSRRLAAILAADIAGYSALMGSDEARTVRDLKGHQAVVLPMIGEFGGRIIDTAGDGVLAEFPSVVNAVECAVAIQSKMAERNTAIEPERRMQFRMGINLGDIIYDNDRIFGDGINVAARLEGIAEPGGIRLSGAVHDQVRNKVAASFDDLGEHELKNIAERVRVYKVRKAEDGASRFDITPGNLWRHTSPYRGLAAMEEKDSDYFFGRTRETVEVLNALATSPDRLPVLIGNSGVGKSSLAQAGVLAALKREAWPKDSSTPRAWPHGLADSRRWCFLTLRPGTEPVGSLVETFLDTWQLDRTSTAWPTRRAEWVDALLSRKLTLRDLLDQTARRYSELQRSDPTTFFLYVDQGEELYVRAVERERHCFSEIVAAAVSEQQLRVVMSLRADFFGELLKDAALQDVSRKIEVPPLREAQLREVVSRPAELLRARFESDHLAGDIAKRTADESAADAGALPLLSYLLDDMWLRMVERGDGVLRLPAQSIELGHVLVQRADAFLMRNPNAKDKLRRIFTLKLATVREDGEPTRRRALRSEFSDEEWRLVSELADHPNRLLISATPETGETYAEVAHEAIFRRWDKLREWIAAEREFLAWRSGLEAASRVWRATPNASKIDALLMGFALTQAQSWLNKRAADLPEAARSFIVLSHKAARQRRLWVEALVGVLVFAVITSLLGWLNNAYLQQQWRWYAITRPYIVSQVRPHVLTIAAEHALKPGDSFKECATTCPEMIVVPAGSFMMGTPATENGHESSEDPQHKVTIAKAFSVSKHELTFAEWDVCSAYGDCERHIDDNGFGRDRQPVINVTWDDAQHYVAWLAKVTGKPYRLLSEAEWEYAARAGTQAAFPWGNDIGSGNANCNDCGSQWDFKRPAPVGSFAPNGFGLYDMAGNVTEWVEDCDHPDYNAAPDDGSTWMEGGNCGYRILRGGSWIDPPELLRSGRRVTQSTGFRFSNYGVRLGRTLISK